MSSLDIAAAMAELASEPTTLLFHAEMIPPLAASVGDDVQRSQPPLAPAGPLNAYSTFLASRPPALETYAIAEILSLAHLAPRLPLHIVHLSALEALPLLRDARAAGVNVTAETCFHYLALAAEAIADGDTRHKCCPPIREQANQDGLWEELLRGPDSVLATVVSDHSPCTPDLKLLPHTIPGSCAASRAEAADERPADDGDFFAAWGGVSSVGLGLPILWTAGAERGLSVEHVAKWCCRNTAAQVGLDHRKGDIAVGMDGDVCVFDDEAEWVLGAESLLFRNKCSPYQGRKMRGMVRETWVRGVKVFNRDEGFGKGPVGELLLEPRTA